MFLFIEPIGLTDELMRKLCEEMQRHSRGGNGYVIWHESMRLIIPRAHVSLIHAQGISNQVWLDHIDQASGLEVVLVSERAISIGFPVLQPDFAFIELAAIAHIAHEFSELRACQKFCV
jgi:hypothetical protein